MDSLRQTRRIVVEREGKESRQMAGGREGFTGDCAHVRTSSRDSRPDPHAVHAIRSISRLPTPHVQCAPAAIRWHTLSATRVAAGARARGGSVDEEAGSIVLKAATHLDKTREMHGGSHVCKFSPREKRDMG